MFFCTPDRTFKRLSSCYKRAERFAKKGTIDQSHPLAAAWGNCQMLLDAKSDYKVKPKNPSKLNMHYERRRNDAAYDIVLLDWFAERVENFSKGNLLEGDTSLQAMLFEWKERLLFDPRLMRNE